MVVDKESIKRISRARLVDEVTENLRSLILSGQIEPGTQLLQVELAEMLGVSRTPLREAFRLLEQDGLIRVANGNRTVVVVDPDPQEVLDLYAIREVIDGLAASLCASKPLDKSELKLLLEPMKEMERWRARKTGSPGESDFVASHARFHTAMIECSGNYPLQDMISLVQMSSQMGIARHVRTHRPDLETDLLAKIPVMIKQDNDDHRAIYDAIVAGDAREAEVAARQHVRNLSENVRPFAE